MIKVLIVDDHELVRTGMERLLADTNDIEVIGDASDGEEAIELCRTFHPNIVLMDINMPGMGGIETTKKLLRLHNDIKVIIVTVFAEEPFPSRLLQIGASGYVTKGSTKEELLQAIRTVNAGLRYINPKIAQKLALERLSPDAENSPMRDLTSRELGVLTMITRGIKAEEIGKKMNISAKTVHSYRYRLFNKLNVSNDVELTYLAIRFGLITIDQIMDGTIGDHEQSY